jgi:hypothetical protein
VDSLWTLHRVHKDRWGTVKYRVNPMVADIIVHLGDE